MISKHSFGYFGLHYSDDAVSGDTIEPSSRNAQDNSNADEGTCLRYRIAVIERLCGCICVPEARDDINLSTSPIERNT